LKWTVRRKGEREDPTRKIGRQRVRKARSSPKQQTSGRDGRKRRGWSRCSAFLVLVFQRESKT